MRRPAIQFLALVSGLLPGAAPASADNMYPSFQFICLPKLLHFSVTTVAFDNIDPTSAPQGRELAVSPLYVLSKHPYSCVWKGGAIRAKLTYYHTAQPRGFCGDVEYGTVEISWNGMLLTKIEQNSCGGDWHSVNVDELADFKPRTFWIEHCHRSPSMNGGGNISDCEKTDFDVAAGSLRKQPR